jgi:hypothetical protein
MSQKGNQLKVSDLGGLGGGKKGASALKKIKAAKGGAGANKLAGLTNSIKIVKRKIIKKGKGAKGKGGKGKNLAGSAMDRLK